jgi:hypothetical protein
LPKKRPNSVAEKLTLKKEQCADGGESTKHNEFTIQEKLNILEELGANQLTIKSVCLKYGRSRSSVKRWKKMQEEWKVEVTKHMGGKTKRFYANNGLERVKDAFHEFYDLNRNMPKDLKLPITCEYYFIFSCAHSTPDELLISGFPTSCPLHRGYLLNNGHKN